MKFTVVIFLTLFSVGCFQYNSAFYRPGMLKEKIYIANHDASVQMVYSTEERPRSLTSGTVISKKYGLVLTVAHGVSTDTRFVIVRPPPYDEDGSSVPAKIIALEHGDYDLVVLFVDPEVVEFQSDVAIFGGSSEELEHEPVYLISYPLGILKHVTTFGYVIGIFPKPVIGVVPHLTVDIWAQSGSSGGPLFLQKNHRLVGITRVYMGGGSMYPTLLFITPEKIRSFLEKNNIEYRK